MRTESNLRAAIDALAGSQPDTSKMVETLLRPGPIPPSRASTRVARPLIAAVIVAAVATTSAVISTAHQQHGDRNAGAGYVRALTWTFSVDTVPGYTITRDYNSQTGPPGSTIGTYGTADITATGKSRVTGTIEYDSMISKPLRTADFTTIAGVRYYFRSGRHVTRQGGLTPAQYAHPWVAVSQADHGPQLSWQQPDGSQYVIAGSFGFLPKTYNFDNAQARKILLKIARAVHPGLAEPVRLPFHVSVLPGGLVPVKLEITPPTLVANINSPGVHPTPLAACLDYATTQQPSPEDPTESILSVCRIRIQTTEQAALTNAPDPFNHTFSAKWVVRRLPDGNLLAVGVGVGHSDAATTTELTHIADTTDVTPKLTDTGTWLKLR